MCLLPKLLPKSHFQEQETVRCVKLRGGGGGGHQKSYSVFATRSSSKSQPSEETVMCVKCGGERCEGASKSLGCVYYTGFFQKSTSKTKKQ